MLLFGMLTLHGVGQNLIPNPGFEIYDTCPTFGVQTPMDWTMIEHTPDYSNSCAPVGSYSVPINYFGYQQAHSGCAFEGFWFYDSFGPSNWREFLQGKLDSTLIIGDKYYFSFQINLSDGYPYVWSGMNKIGFKLSTSSFGLGDDGSPAVDNTATFYSDSIVSDTANWISINGSIIADSAYKYITLGCFFDDQHIQFDTIKGGPRYCSYYFFDDICLSHDSLSCIGVTQQCYVPNYIHNAWETNIYVSPNPFYEYLNFDAPTADTYQLELYDTNATLIISKYVTTGSGINTGHLKPGVYFYRIKKDNILMKSGKVVRLLNF